MGGGAWWATVHGVAKSRTRLSYFTFTFHFHALEKEMATNSSVSCLENPRDGGAWWAAVYGVAQSRTRLKRLSSSSSSRGTPMSHRCGIHQSSWGPVGVWSQLHPVSLAFCPGLLSLQPLSKRLHMCTSEGYGIHNLKKPLANEG